MNESARLSKMLWDARESLEMWADVVEHVAANNTGMRMDTHLRRLIKDLDEYRAERGWSPNGFGGET